MSNLIAERNELIMVGEYLIKDLEMLMKLRSNNQKEMFLRIIEDFLPK